jgi:hypothetical protein
MTYRCSRDWSTGEKLQTIVTVTKAFRCCSRSVPAGVRKRVKSTAAEYTTQSRILHNEIAAPRWGQGHCFSPLYAKARELRHLMGFVVGVGCSIEAPLPGE